MPGCKFQLEWLHDPDFKSWLASHTDPSKCYCKICKKAFLVDTMGKTAVKSHAKGKKHMKNVALLKGNSKLTSTLTSNTSITPDGSSTGNISNQPGSSTGPKTANVVQSFACSADVLSAEVLWSIKCIDSHYSYHSNEHISDTFQTMFPDSVIASKFSCGETKSSYLIRYGIGPYMKTLLQHRVKEDDYVLLFDESLNREMQKKQLDILVRLWDNDCIQSRFFHSQFLGHASAHNLVEACIESVSVLNVHNIVQISMDGPNVNWSFYNKFENIIQDQCSKTLLPTGSCGLHQIHNAFRFGSSQSDWNIDSYLSSLYYLFHDSPARRDDYEQAMAELSDSDRKGWMAVSSGENCGMLSENFFSSPMDKHPWKEGFL